MPFDPLVEDATLRTSASNKLPPGKLAAGAPESVFVTLAHRIVAWLDSSPWGFLLVGRGFNVPTLLLLSLASALLFWVAALTEPWSGGFWNVLILALFLAVGAALQLAGIISQWAAGRKHEGYRSHGVFRTVEWIVWPEWAFLDWLQDNKPMAAGLATLVLACSIGFGVILLIGIVKLTWLVWLLGSVVGVAWLFAGYCWLASRRARNRS